MPRNYVALRNSPDWLSFDPETSREICRIIHIPETTIIDYIAIWDKILNVDFRTFRHILKEIALRNFLRIPHAQLISCRDINSLNPAADDLFAFTDDDDWFSPNIFGQEVTAHGVKWSSIRIGRGFSADFDYSNEPALSLRPTSRQIYTNTYIASGEAIRTVGLDNIVEHVDAMRAFQCGQFLPRESDQYLSCANKSPASALSARFLMPSQDFLDDPAREFRQFRRLIEAVEVPLGYDWLAEPIADFKALVFQAIPE